jgi:hypothetical protein
VEAPIGILLPVVPDVLLIYPKCPQSEGYIYPVGPAEDFDSMLKRSCVGACLVVPVDHRVAFIEPLSPACFFEVYIKLDNGWLQVIDGMVGPDADIVEYGYDGILFLVVVIIVDEEAVVVHPAHMVPVFLVVGTQVRLVGMEDRIDGGGIHGGLCVRLKLSPASGWNDG